MMSLWDALRMNMMISYQELVRTFPKSPDGDLVMINFICKEASMSDEVVKPGNEEALSSFVE